ncbi:MAG: hypothetical protein K1060chlam4_01479 [Candidatus Anoxychlamydiales bacterium]|nr:hypothetical protein [Candidatus Anoxychlamydiales bacterium]
MSFLVNASPSIYNATLGLLKNYPFICEKFSGFCELNQGFFDENQQTLLIGTLAASALTMVGGFYGMFLNRDGTLAISALFLTTSVLGAAALYSQYQFLVEAALWK